MPSLFLMLVMILPVVLLEKRVSIGRLEQGQSSHSYLPAPVTPLKGLVALDLDQTAESQLTLLDLGTGAWLWSLASSAVRAGVLDAVRHDEFDKQMDGCQSSLPPSRERK